nr:hypothetical protein CFP56_19184 [Quercus suber]
MIGMGPDPVSRMTLSLISLVPHSLVDANTVPSNFLAHRAQEVRGIVRGFGSAQQYVAFVVRLLKFGDILGDVDSVKYRYGIVRYREARFVRLRCDTRGADNLSGIDGSTIDSENPSASRVAFDTRHPAVELDVALEVSDRKTQAVRLDYLAASIRMVSSGTSDSEGARILSLSAQWLQ